MSVLVHLEAGRSLYLDVLLSVNRHERNLFEYLQSGFCLRCLVMLDIVGQPVDIVPDQLPAAGHDYFVHFLCPDGVCAVRVLCRQICR